METKDSYTDVPITKKYSHFEYLFDLWKGHTTLHSEKDSLSFSYPKVPGTQISEICLHQVDSPQGQSSQDSVYWKLLVKFKDNIYQTLFQDQKFAKFPHLIHYLPVCLVEEKEISFSFDNAEYFIKTNIIHLPNNQLLIHYGILSSPIEKCKQDFIFHLHVQDENFTHLHFLKRECDNESDESRKHSLNKRLLELENKLQISNKRLKKISEEKTALARELANLSKLNAALLKNNSNLNTSFLLPQKNEKYDSVIAELHEKIREKQKVGQLPFSLDSRYISSNAHSALDSSTSTNESTNTTTSENE